MLYVCSINTKKSYRITGSSIEVKILKILHILSDSNIGGAGTYVANIIKNYDRNKFIMSVLIPNGSAAAKLFEGLDVRVIEADIAADKSFDIRSVAKLRKYIKESGCDIIHTHGSASARLASKGICKSVFTKHTLSVSGNGIKGLIDRLLYRVAGGYAIAVSQAARDNLISLGFNRKKIYTVLNGVTDMLPADQQIKAESKKSFGIDSSKYVIGCVARFSPEKDYPTFLHAAKTASEKCDKLAFLLCGDGSTRNEMKSLAKSLGIYPKCVFAGNVYDIQRAYHAMDLYCITSIHESFGQSLVEAWSAQLPAVTTDAKGFVEISQNGVTSVICKRSNPEEISDAIIDLYENHDKARLLAQNGRKLYEEKYDSITFTRGIEKVYENILNK